MKNSGLTMLQAAERLHVDPRILESLEAENFEALGAPVYARGHLRHYAELVGESAAELSAIYGSSVRTEQQPDLTRIVKAPAAAGVEPADRARRWSFCRSSRSRAQCGGYCHCREETCGCRASCSTERSPGVTTPLAMDRCVRGLLRAAAQSALAGTPRGSNSGSAAQIHPPPQTPAATASRDTTAATILPDPPALRRQESRAGRETQLTLHYSADSWTEVYERSGRRLFYDVGAANSVKTVSGSAPLRVVLGNASGVSVEVNGHGKPIGKMVAAGRQRAISHRPLRPCRCARTPPLTEVELAEQIQPIRGMNDILPAEIGAWQYLERRVREL